MRFSQKQFDELTGREVYEILRLRVAVFVVEQRCAYPELDGLDPESVHLMGYVAKDLVAYARWYPSEGATILGRIAVRRDLRGGGLGRRLTMEALTRIGPGEIRIAAQQRFETLYRSFGFHTVSEPYDDYGLEHIDMVRPLLRHRPVRG